MSYSFKSQLKIGAFGESLFLMANPELRPNCDLHGDFLRPDGGKVELKTDMWSIDATPNYFIERFSDKAARSPGGPWQSLSHGAATFCYFFLPSLTFFTFDTKQLVGRLETILPTLSPVDVRNTSHITQGYRVPRALLQDIATETRLKVVRI